MFERKCGQFRYLVEAVWRCCVATLVLAFLLFVNHVARADDVATLTSWTTGTTGPSRFTSGTDRLLIFTAGMEAGSNLTISSVTYGGQTMTPVVTDSAGTSTYARAYIFYLKDSDISDATSDNFSINWSGSTSSVHYSARMFENVDQSDPIRDFDNASTDSSTPNPIVTPSMTVIDGDLVVAAAQCGNSNSYSWNNSFVEGTDESNGSSQHSSAHRSVTSDGTMTASATNSSPNRQVIVAAVLKNNTPDVPTIYYVRPDGSDSNSGTGSSSSEAWATVAAAVDKTQIDPGDIVYVMVGTYTGSPTPSIDGNSSSPIRFIGDRTGAIFGTSGNVVLKASSGNEAIDLDNDDYLEFVGFQFDGSNGGSGQQVVELDDCDGIVFEQCEIIEGDSDGIDSDNSSVTVINCLIYDNGGHGIDTGNSSNVTVWNSTIAHNGGDGVNIDSGTITVRNSILAYNSDDGFDDNGGSLIHSYNIVYNNGGTDFEGTSQSTGESTSNPDFTDASGRDYTLEDDSPAIDAGTNAAGTVDVDFDDLGRPIDAGWDIGAYEAPPHEPTIYYVRTDGSDSNSGTGSSSSEAWQTLREATRKDVLQPGDIIYVKAGTYTERIQPDEDGASGSPIRLVADTTGVVSGWPAGDVIIEHNDEKVVEFNGDDYWTLEGFKIQGWSDKEAVKVKDSDGIELKNLEIYDGKEGIRTDAAEVLITNCIVRDSVEEGVIIADANDDVTIINCVIAHNAQDGIEQDDGILTISNSIIAFNSDDGLDRDGGTLNHSYNIVHSNSGGNFEGTSQGTGELTSDPLFTDTNGRDYTLQGNSPAINAGTDVTGVVDDDFFGNARPIGSNWDLGIYEYPLVGSWPMNEGSGSTVSDDSGNDYDGSLEGGADWESARCSETVKLDGSGDWIDLGQINLGSAGYTLSVWFKSATAARQTIFAATAAGTTNHLMYVELSDAGLLQFVHRSPVASSGGTTLASTDTYNDGRWHHVAALKSKTELRLYVDGELVDTVADTTSIHSSLDIVLGRYGVSQGQYYLNGSVDEVLLYGTDLSEAEIAELTGLVGRWRLDATSGSTALDSSIFGNDGSLSSGFTFDSSSVSPAKVDNGLQFDGSSQYISVPNSASLQMTSGLTISAWIKGDDWGSGSFANVIVRKGEGNPNNYQLSISDGQVSLVLDDSDGGGYRGDTVLSTGTWYFVAATWDGSEVRIFVNGVMDHASPYSKSSAIGTDTRALYIGGRSGTDYFEGTLDDVHIYNRALCEDDLLDTYNGYTPQGVRVTKWLEKK